MVALESLTKRTPPISATCSSRCGHAGEAAQPLAHRVAVEPHRERRGRRGHRVGDVVLAEEAELVDREQRLAVVEDRPLGQRHLAVGGGAVAEGDAARAAAEVGAGQGRVVGVVDGDVVVALVGEDPQLRRQVGVEVGVAVEVVGGEVEEDGALGGEGGGVLELEAGGLADDGRIGLDLPASEESGVPTLPATATGSPAVR